MNYPTRTGLLPIGCALGIHWPQDSTEGDDGITDDVCRRCGAHRLRLGARRSRWERP